MAPRNKFTREEMIEAAVSVVRYKGTDALTAKAVAEMLGTSTRPVFTCFGTMEEVRREVYDAAEAVFTAYTEEGFKEKIPFLGYGVQYLRFAKEEPELFRMLFLSGNGKTGDGAVCTMKRSYDKIGESLKRFYRMNDTEAMTFFQGLWLAVFSLAVLTVTGGCPYTKEQQTKILTGYSVAICKAIKEIPGFAAGEYDRDTVFRTFLPDGGETTDGRYGEP